MTDSFAQPYDSLADTGEQPDRRAQLEFHLKTGDYFPLLSTIMCFLEEDMLECESGTAITLAPVKAEMIKSVREDLLYLHKNYRIEAKEQV